MVNRTIIKDLFRTIKHRFSRFFTLLTMTAIGVSFFVGVSGSVKVMKDSVVAYQKQQQMAQITIYSNYGFSSADVDAIGKLGYVKKVQGEYFVDTLVHIQSSNYIFRIQPYYKDAILNQPKLVAGKFPSQHQECAIDSLYFDKVEIGDTLVIDSTDDIKVESCRVTGFVESPLYLNKTRETSTYHNQTLKGFMYVFEDDLSSKYFQRVVLLTNIEQNVFHKNYQVQETKIKNTLEIFSDTQKLVQFNDIKNEALAKIKDAQDTYQKEYQNYINEITKAKNEIAENQDKLSDAKVQLDDGSRALDDAYQKLLDGQKLGEQELVESEKKLVESQKAVDRNRSQFEQRKIELQTQKEQLQQQLQQTNTTKDNLLMLKDGISSLLCSECTLEQAILRNQSFQLLQQMGFDTSLTLSQVLTQLNMQQSELQQNEDLPDEEKQQQLVQVQQAMQLVQSYMLTLDSPAQGLSEFPNLSQGLASYTLTEKTVGQLLEEMNEQLLQLDSGKQQLEQGIQSIEQGIITGEQQLQQAQLEINEGYRKLAEGKEKLKQQIASGKIEIDEGRKELYEKKQDYLSGVHSLNDAISKLNHETKDAEQEFAQARDKIADAQKEVIDLEDPEWTILGIDKQYATATFDSTLKQMQAISTIFPIFFLLVSFLVGLTTLTRMVEEERLQIGVLKALGYGWFACSAKYLIYALLASVFGGVFGTVLGYLTFPKIIYHSWRMMYILPNDMIAIDVPIILFANCLFIVLMLFVTLLACYKTTRTNSAALLRPPVAVQGKRTLLEYFTFFWKRISFINKVTIRNLFRFKKRFFMTVLGISGCTALLLAGFGIRGSISKINRYQYEDIFHFNAILVLKNENDVKNVESDAMFNQSLNVSFYQADAYQGSAVETTNIIVTDQDISKMITLKNNHQFIQLDQQGVVITQKLAKQLNVKVGDLITLENDQEVKKQVKVVAIVEQYIEHYIYMTKAYYQSVYQEKPVQSSLLVKTDQIEELKNKYMSDERIEQTIYFQDYIDRFDGMISGLNLIVVVIILSSGALALVVLSNLTMVNIEERSREIATLKVLGFTQKEVREYIYKENYILTLFGSLLGCLLGKNLHYFIMTQVEMDYVYFVKDISIWIYALAVIITFIFTFIVHRMMSKKLRNIDMVSSLKSVE